MRSHAEELRGASRLAIGAIAAIVDVVESMHGTIQGTVVRRRRIDGRALGVTGFAYRSVRSVVGLVGGSLDVLLRALRPLLRRRSGWPGREPVLSALNGVLGDYLASTRNPLAIPMTLRVEGPARPRIAVFIHGLCMGDADWRRNGEDYGAALARRGFTPVYVRYNSGSPIAANGRRLDRQLEKLVAGWPVPVADVSLVGHSMGGLVARRACEAAERSGHSWRQALRHMVFLGTPHRGAPLERGGGWIDLLMGASAYTAPLARIGGVRSAGIVDLRHGLALPPPSGVALHAVAATVARRAGKATDYLGDGLVPLASALGEVEASQQCIIRGAGHLDLLGNPEVREQLLRWLAPANPRAATA